MARQITQLLTLLLAITFLSHEVSGAESDKKRKKLPKKIEVPQGYIPVDPSKVEVTKDLYKDAETEAQNALLKDKNFEGVIQFIRGEVLWGEEGKQPDPQYKTLLKKGDLLKVGKDSFVKIITQKRCIGIIYGPATVSMPRSDENDVWTLDKSNLRWICPGKSEEKLLIDGEPLTLFSGEIFYHKDRLLVISGTPESENGTLESKKLYAIKSSQWTEVKDQPNEFHLWTMNQELPVPKESNPWPEPPKPRKYRISAGPQFGFGVFNYNNSDIKNQIPAGLNGGRITGYFHRDKDKKVYTLTFMGAEHSQSMGMATIKFNSISVGMRLHSEKNWSLTCRLGFGSAEMQVGYNSGSNFYSHYMHYGLLTVAGGIDRIFTFKGWDWIGLIVSGEAILNTTIGSPDFRDGGNPSGDPYYGTLANSQMTAVDFAVHVGPVIYF